VQVFRIGHTGAQSVWSGTVLTSPAGSAANDDEK
jgi:hypothetical protein